MKRKLTSIILFLAFVACGKKVKPLDHPFADIQGLCEHHLRCIEANNRPCFERSLLTYKEFHDSVYQELPEAKDKVGNISEDVYWAWTLPDRKKSMRKLFDQFGGMKLLETRIGEPKKIIRLENIRLHRDIPVYAVFYSAKENKNVTLISSEIFKAVVEVNGQFKIWSSTYE